MLEFAFTFALVFVLTRGTFRVPGGFAPSVLVNTRTRPRKPRTLAQRLEAAGIVILPKGKVRAHQRQALRQYRKGVWKVGWVILAYPRIYGDTLDAVFKFIFKNRNTRGNAEVIFLFASILSPMLFAWSKSPWLLAVSIVAMISMGSVLILEGIVYTGSPQNMAMAASRWRTMPASDYYDWVGFLMRLQAPECVLAISDRAMTAVPGVEMVVEYLHEDPFLIARLGKKWCYIAAWNTGDAELDSV